MGPKAVGEGTVLETRYWGIEVRGSRNIVTRAMDWQLVLDLAARSDGVGSIGIVMDVGGGAAPEAWVALGGTVDPGVVGSLVPDVDAQPPVTTLPEAPSPHRLTWRARRAGELLGRLRPVEAVVPRLLGRRGRSRIHVTATPFQGGEVVLEVAAEADDADRGLLAGALEHDAGLLTVGEAVEFDALDG